MDEQTREQGGVHVLLGVGARVVGREAVAAGTGRDAPGVRDLARHQRPAIFEVADLQERLGVIFDGESVRDPLHRLGLEEGEGHEAGAQQHPGGPHRSIGPLLVPEGVGHLRRPRVRWAGLATRREAVEAPSSGGVDVVVEGAAQDVGHPATVVATAAREVARSAVVRTRARQRSCGRRGRAAHGVAMMRAPRVRAGAETAGGTAVVRGRRNGPGPGPESGAGRCRRRRPRTRRRRGSACGRHGTIGGPRRWRSPRSRRRRATAAARRSG